MKINLAVAAILAGSLSMMTIRAADSAANLLQKGIFTQDTVGDLDGAIVLYRQVARSGAAKYAGQAQWRLVQALLLKGDLTSAGQELQTLAMQYPARSGDGADGTGFASRIWKWS